MASKSDYGTMRSSGFRYLCFLLSWHSFIKEREVIMPQNKFQRMAFAFLTVVITVPAFVFYSVDVVNGDLLMQLTGSDSVLGAVAAQGGIMMFGHMLPIWLVMLIEFVCAYTLEILVGSPTSFRLAIGVFDPRKSHPMHFESAIICATVGIMCPAMSLLAAIFYYPYYSGFHILTLLANWLELVCANLPFAYFSQMFFIQPFVRRAFGFLFRKQIQERKAPSENESELPYDETDVISEILRKINELDSDIGIVNAKRKSLEARVTTRIDELDSDIGNVNQKRKELEVKVHNRIEELDSDIGNVNQKRKELKQHVEEHVGKMDK